MGLFSGVVSIGNDCRDVAGDPRADENEPVGERLEKSSIMGL